MARDDSDAGEESVAAPLATRLHAVPSRGPWSLALHGGAGGRIQELGDEDRRAFERGLTAAHRAGASVLEAGGSALDAVCAAVRELEDDPLFNAGRGAALTAAGEAEHDAAVMAGSGAAGAVAVSRHARNPVLLARHVLERSEHVLIVSPSADLVTAWGQETAEREWFVTAERRAQLARIRSRDLVASRHGTVGAVARDAAGNLAAATSTGGMANQTEGRVGDSPIIGAGTYAADDALAVSCTGEGEAFIVSVLSHDIAARIRYLGEPIAEAVGAAIQQDLTARSASGGLVAVAPDGTVVVAHNSPMMFAAFHDEDRLVVLT